jgi:hypothetical protein
MTDMLQTAFPDVAGEKIESVRVRRLDDVAGEMDFPEPIFAKLDTQGYEDKVLAGGGQTMRRVKFAIVETSFEPLYVGQPLFADIYQRMVALGFRYIGAREQLCHPEDGRILVQDSFFLRD